MIENIRLRQLQPHPDNPRFSVNEEVIQQITENINNGFDEAHALIVRRLGKGYQIISGHHRYEAAKLAKLREVPCWVRDYNDEEAYMQLMLCNTQSELHPLEQGRHARESGLTVRKYAEVVGASFTPINHRMMAYDVFLRSGIDPFEAKQIWSKLAIVHGAPDWMWVALVNVIIEHNWTIDKVRKTIAEFKGIIEPLDWMDGDSIAVDIVNGYMKKSELSAMAKQVDEIEYTER